MQGLRPRGSRSRLSGAPCVNPTRSSHPLPHRSHFVTSAPIVVLEVLSSLEGERQRDEKDKVAEYQSVPTNLRYVMLESERRGIPCSGENRDSASGAGNP
jgi:Uma2 family endonuclease